MSKIQPRAALPGPEWEQPCSDCGSLMPRRYSLICDRCIGIRRADAPAPRVTTVQAYGLASIQPDTLSRAAYRAGVSLIDARRLIAMLILEMGAI